MLPLNPYALNLTTYKGITQQLLLVVVRKAGQRHRGTFSENPPLTTIPETVHRNYIFHVHFGC